MRAPNSRRNAVAIVSEKVAGSLRFVSNIEFDREVR